jgi:hypothetical protein
MDGNYEKECPLYQLLNLHVLEPKNIEILEAFYFFIAFLFFAYTPLFYAIIPKRNRAPPCF